MNPFFQVMHTENKSFAKGFQLILKVFMDTMQRVWLILVTIHPKYLEGYTPSLLD